MFSLDCRNLLPVLAPLLVLACDKGQRQKPPTDDTAPTHDTGPDPDTGSGCDTGYLDDDGECVPAACGTGTWGNLETDESTVYVDIAAAEGGDGSEVAPFTSIQAGLDVAGDADGGLVAVAAGTYPETLELGRGHDGVHLAGRCRDLVVIDASVGDESTSGIDVDVKSAEVEVSGVTVREAHSVGVRIGSGTMSFRDSAVTASGVVGVGAYQAGIQATALTVEACEVRGSIGIGLAAIDTGTSVTLRETNIVDTQTDENGAYGIGIQVQDGARLDGEGCEVSDSYGLGLLVSGSGTSATLRETSIVDTQTDEEGDFGYGIQVSEGASLDADSCGIGRNTLAGVLALDSGTLVTLRETAIEDTRTDGTGEGGYGIQAYDGAELDAESCRIGGNANVGVLALGSGTLIALLETTIEDTQTAEDGAYGVGIAIQDGASLDAERCEILGSTTTGVSVADSGTSVALRETCIEDTKPNENGECGFGIDVYDGASLEAEDCEVRRSTSTGAKASGSGTSVVLRETSLRDTRPEESGKGGLGIEVRDGADLQAEGCEIRGNSSTGLLAYDSGTAVALRETIIADTQPDETGGGGFGIQLYDGASLDAEACEISGNEMVGLAAFDSGTSVSLRESAIGDTRIDENGEHGSGIEICDGAKLEAEDCEIRGNTNVGVLAQGPGTSVTLLEVSIEDTHPDGQGDFGFGIQVSDGASLDAQDCVVGGSTSAGLLVLDSDTSVTLRDTSIASTMRGEIQTVGIGVAGQESATVVATGLEVSSNEGPGFYIFDENTQLTCSDCVLRDNQFAGAVVVWDATLELASSLIEGTTDQENLGGGLGIFADPWLGGPPSLSVTDTTIQDNGIAGVWVSGQGSYSFSGNTIRGGEGWTRESLTKCGDAVFAGNGATAWDGSSGLLLEDNELRDGLGAGLFLDDASATISGNSYADNAVDLVVQGTDCTSPPDGYDDEAIGTAEFCPTYDYATCWDEFALVLELAEPESGYGAAFLHHSLPGPDVLHLPALPVAPPHALNSLLVLPPAPQLEPLKLRLRPLRHEPAPTVPLVVSGDH